MENGTQLRRGLVDAVEARLDEYLAGAGAEVQKLAAGFRAMRWSPEEIEAFMATARLAGSSVVRSGVNDTLLAELAEAKVTAGIDVDYVAMKKAGAHVTTVHVELTSEQQQFLREDLAGLTTLQFPPVGRGERVKHGVAHALNAMMDVQLFRRVPKDAVILEVGASLRAAVRRGHTVGKYYAIKPFLDTKDLQRYHSEMRAVRVLSTRSGRHALKDEQAELARVIVSNEDAVIIKKKIQEVDVAAEYILSLQSNWDIPMSHLPAVMSRCGARVWYLVMNRVPGLDFLGDRACGKVRGLDVVWEADAINDTVSFWFDGDSSLPYKHKLSIVREYQEACTREFVCNGHLYVVSESDMSTGSQLVLSCVDMGVKQVAPTLGYDVVTTGGESMLEIVVPVLTSSVAVGARRKFERASFMVGSESFSRVLQERVIAGKDGTVDTVIAFARSNRVNVVYNGVRVSVEHPIAVQHFRQFAVAVDALAVDILKSADMETKAVAAGLAGGQFKFVSPSALIGIVSGFTEASSSLYDAVVRRMHELVDAAESDMSVEVKTVSGVKRTLRRSRMNVAPVGRSRRLFQAECYCQEKRELDEMLLGEKGGLTVREHEVLTHYKTFLAARECARCVSVADVLARAYEESECDDGEDFYSCVGSDSDVGDSGYSSGGSTAAPAEDVAEGDGRLAWKCEGTQIEEDVERPMSLNEERKVLERCDERYGAAETAEAGVKTRMRLAAEEYVHVLRLQAKAAEDDLRQKRMIASMSGDSSQQSLDAISDEYCWYSYVTIGSGGVVVAVDRAGVTIRDFQRVYDYQRDVFEPVVVDRDGVPRVSAEVSAKVCTSGKMKVWNQPTLIDKSLRLLRPGGWLDGPEVVLQFVNGVFGCGKTRGIKQSYTRQVTQPGQRLILTSSRKAAEQLREELFGDVNSRAGRMYVRTYDSVLMHGVTEWFPEVAMDELAALSMGQAVLVLAYLQPARARAYGDFYQMEPKPFCDWEFQYPTVAPLCHMEYMSMSHRVKLSIMASSLKLYPAEAKLSVCKCCPHVVESEEGGPFVQQVSSVAEVPVEKDAAYFTASQSDAKAVREMLRASGDFVGDAANRAVCTYAESQGMTVENAICVRLERRTKPGSIHHEKKRINVGKSRAKGTVRYFTCANEQDEMVKAAGDAQDEFLREQVRKNSEEVWQRVIAAGGVDQAFSGYFDMCSVTYRYE